jgi:hypothetical protein
VVPVTVAQLSLAAGNYVVRASGTAAHSSGSDNDDECELQLNGTQFAKVEMLPSWDNSAREPYSLVGTASLTSAGTVSLVCTVQTGSTDGLVNNNYLVASQVDAIN